MMKLYIKSTTLSLVPKHVYVIDLLGENHKQCYGWLTKVLKNNVCVMDLTDDGSDVSSYMLYPEDYSLIDDLGEQNSLSGFLGYIRAKETTKKYPNAMNTLGE